MNKKIISLIVISFLGFIVFAQESNIELANKFYNQDKYEEAYNNYKTAIKENEPNAVLFYRFAYSCEQIKKSSNYYNKYYKAAAYLFEKNNDQSNKYYSYVINKENQKGFNHSDYNDEMISKLIKDIDSEINSLEDLISVVMTFVSSHLKICIIIAVILWILGIVLSESTNCVVVYGWKDAIFVIIAGVFFLMSFSDSFKSEDVIFPVILFSIFFLVSIFFSFKGNIKASGHFNIFYIVLSVLVKFVLIFLIPIALVSYLCALTSGKKDGRYRDGTKGNERTANIAFVVGLISLLLIPLVKE